MFERMRSYFHPRRLPAGDAVPSWLHELHPHVSDEGLFQGALPVLPLQPRPRTAGAPATPIYVDGKDAATHPGARKA